MGKDRSPDHVLHVTVQSPEQSYEDVLCQIFLPTGLDEEQVVVHLLPNEIDFSTLGLQREVSIKGGNECTSIVSDRMVCGPSAITSLGADNVKCEIVAQPINGFLIKQSNTVATEVDDGEITFWLTRNSFATPATELISSDTGISLKSIEEKEFAIFGTKYKFSFQINYDVKKNGDISCWPLLIAKSQLKLDEKDEILHSLIHVHQELLGRLDDLLLLLSFASQKRTRCIGWTIRGRNSREKYYRGSFLLPVTAETGDIGIHETLVPKEKIDSYIDATSKRFELYDNKVSLRNALHISLHDKGTIEQQFLSKFSALESLVQGYRKQKDLEYILSPERWKKLKKGIEKYIKKSENPELEKEERKRIYDKLGELNRVSLREAYNSFCSDVLLPEKDLWPVFGGCGESGLSDIRNALIHGLEYPEYMYEAISTADFHLEVLLKRALLVILGGELDTSKVHEAELKFMYGSDVLNYEDDSKKVYSFLNN